MNSCLKKLSVKLIQQNSIQQLNRNQKRKNLDYLIKKEMYRPLPNNCTIKNSTIDGLGLFATEFIEKGTDLGMTHIFDERFDDSVIRLPLGGFFNHSETPNCKIIEEFNYNNFEIHHLRLKSIKDINVGDEITAYYTLYQPNKKK
jgi:SET domain-containing protein